MEKRLGVFLKFTKELQLLSKCQDKQVAAIIVDKDLTQVLSIGLNGGAKDQEDCMCNRGNKYGCIHAEINALIKCSNHCKDRIMIVTTSPCVACAAAIINAPGTFRTVFYLEKWKETEGLNMLEKAGINHLFINYNEYID